MGGENMKSLIGEAEMERIILNLARSIVADGTENAALVGIKTRGVPLAEWIAKKVEALQNKPIDVGSLDISLYRDDLSEIDYRPVVKKPSLPFAVTGRGIVLIDDVLYTGRTIRAAMDALIDMGRPKFIRLMVMVDRGWREFPIQADYVGKVIKTTAAQNVKVCLAATDGKNEIVMRG
jgi:pyrimidine operon attenuation protein/uracil phosphoribosyltransferase